MTAFCHADWSENDVPPSGQLAAKFSAGLAAEPGLKVAVVATEVTGEAEAAPELVGDAIDAEEERTYIAGWLADLRPEASVAREIGVDAGINPACKLDTIADMGSERMPASVERARFGNLWSMR